MTPEAPPPGWYSHPRDRSQQRYWNGSSWEDQYRRVPMADPVSAESSQTPSVNESNSVPRLPGYAALSSLLTQLQQRAALLNEPANRSGPPLDKQRRNALIILAGVLAVVIAIGAIGERLGLISDETAAAPTSAAATPSISPTSAPSPTSTPSASESAIQEPVESQPGEAETVAEEILTEENNEDLAALLAVEDYDLSEEFAGKYEGKLIEFDGNIAYMANHDDYVTRYDMLITAGDYSETSQIGPSFKFEDVNAFDLHLTGSNSPDYVGMGDNLHIIARVEEFNRDMGLFFLDPVSTEVR